MQPTARVSKKDIERIIRRDFFKISINTVMKKLSEYQFNIERLRVWAAILKIVDGDFGKFDKTIQMANQDYRDILAIAEYPEYSDKVGFDDEDFEKKELKAIIKRDFEQYNNWFKYNAKMSHQMRHKKSAPCKKGTPIKRGKSKH